MKHEMFFIEFSAYDTDMSTRIPLSKKEFNKQLKFLRSQTLQTAENESPVTELKIDQKETDTTITNYYFFNCGCADTMLVHYECKPGYCFKK